MGIKDKNDGYEYNTISYVMKWISVLSLPIMIISFLLFGDYLEEYIFMIIVSVIIGAIVLFGFAEIIQILHDIRKIIYKDN